MDGIYIYAIRTRERQRFKIPCKIGLSKTKNSPKTLHGLNCMQGCKRPRPSPFQRLSTRYHGGLLWLYRDIVFDLIMISHCKMCLGSNTTAYEKRLPRITYPFVACSALMSNIIPKISNFSLMKHSHKSKKWKVGKLIPINKIFEVIVALL